MTSTLSTLFPRCPRPARIPAKRARVACGCPTGPATGMERIEVGQRTCVGQHGRVSLHGPVCHPETALSHDRRPGPLEISGPRQGAT